MMVLISEAFEIKREYYFFREIVGSQEFSQKLKTKNFFREKSKNKQMRQKLEN